ncbi:MAG: prolipoprotein diacylglyceryl transferase [Acidobacteria bacterium]|nr:prolipoprotein diacylglyceryl transferase [Acidobacteriota bacterium]MCI0628193.1 prolipoprotein diacylglyceryl transferase [Acidobacteriota bacterium]MCI0722168.1 prolipoprotein diacylglyceryl transferase [Acidobacteriota bacterium]
MFPKLFEYSWLVIHTYGFLLAVAFIAGLSISARAARLQQVDPAKIYDLGLYIAISALVGSKALLLVTELGYYLDHPKEIFSLATLRSGGVYYGGFILAVIVGVTLAKRHKLPVWKVADASAPGIALGQSIGRLGCFAAGCCYGRPTASVFGVTFTNPYSHETVGVPLGVPLHPVQIYESLASLILFAILWQALKRKRFDGQIFILYLSLYSCTRYVIEFFRGDMERGFVLGGLLSTSQLISLLLIIIAAVLFFILKRPDAKPVGVKTH